MTRNEALAILQDAAQSPNGLLIHASNVNSAVQALERVRKAEGNPALALLAFKRVDMPDANLAIYKRKQSEAPEGGALPPELKGLHDL